MPPHLPLMPAKQWALSLSPPTKDVGYHLMSLEDYRWVQKGMEMWGETHEVCEKIWRWSQSWSNLLLPLSTNNDDKLMTPHALLTGTLHHAVMHLANNYSPQPHFLPLSLNWTYPRITQPSHPSIQSDRCQQGCSQPCDYKQTNNGCQLCLW